MENGRVLADQQQAEKILSEFIEHELGDYSFKWQIDNTDEQGVYFYFDVAYGLHEIKDVLQMRVDPKKETIEIDMAEDHWEKVESYSWYIKYFWMKVTWA